MEEQGLYIRTTQELEQLVERLQGASVIGVDTEFMRERTYFARLCLVQVASDDVAAIIDPLVVEDLTALKSLLSQSASTKVLHAGSQDLEIFFRMFGEATRPVFDTQVAATLAGFGTQIGYGALVNDVLGVQLDKGDTFTDWMRRPLTATQVEYALNDVRYLPNLYRSLAERLEREKRTEWLEKDFDKLEDPATFTVVPEDQWKRVKRVSSLNRRQLAVAREVAAWREREAMRRDMPKRWVMGDESLIEVARRAPSSVADLQNVRGISDKLSKQAAVGLLEAVQNGLAVPDDALPSLSKKRRPAMDVDAAVDLMVAVVRLRAKQNGVAMPLLASRDDLERLAAGEREGLALLQGWRATMVGNELTQLLDGRIELRIFNGELVVTQTEG